MESLNTPYPRFYDCAHLVPSENREKFKVLKRTAGKALFLDRDGVINVDHGYVAKKDDFHLIPGSVELIKKANKAGYLAIVVTNQAGIGRGYYTERDFAELSNYMARALYEGGAEISAVYHCPYHPTHGIGGYRKDSFDRKPNPGMLCKAKRDFQLNLSKCLLIGDNVSDIEAGMRAKIGKSFILNFQGNAASLPKGAVSVEQLCEVGRLL